MKNVMTMDLALKTMKKVFPEGVFNTEKLIRGIHYYLDMFEFFPNAEEEDTLFPVIGEKGVVVGVATYRQTFNEVGPDVYTGETLYFPDVVIALGAIDKYYGGEDRYAVRRLIPEEGWKDSKTGEALPCFKAAVEWWEHGINHYDEFRVFPNDFKVDTGLEENAWPGFGYWDSVAEAEEEGGEE